MATIIAGKNLAQLNPELYGEGFSKVIVMSIMAGNSLSPDANKKIVNVLAPNIKSITRVEGQRIPVETHNVYFTRGSYSTDVPEFGQKIESFKLKAGEGFNATVFKHEMEEILDAQEAGVDLVQLDAEAVAKYARVYMNVMKPNKRLLALLTGHSDALTIPAEKTLTDSYTSDWGALRGEDNTSFLNPTKVDKYKGASHYRGLQGTVLTSDDIFECAELIKSYNSYSGDDILALASARTIYNLGVLYNANVNKDEHLIDGTPVVNVAGVKFIEIPTMADNFVVFYDGGCLDLLLQCENKTESQRGLALVTEKDLKAIQSPHDTDGMKLRVFPEELIVLRREALVVLDIARKGKTATGKEGWMETAGVTELEAFCKQLYKSYANMSK